VADGKGPKDGKSTSSAKGAARTGKRNPATRAGTSRKSASPNATFRLRGELRGPAPTVGPRAQRTTALIMDTARAVFLAKGYHGLRIDDIADAAGVSRASFYTYFPSKRDLLLALGQQTFEATDRALDEIDALGDDWGTESPYELVRIYMRMLEDHGAFVLVWSQATYGDEELARAGVRARLATGRRLGRVLQRVGAPSARLDDEATRVGLALLVMMDRYWSYWRVNNFPFSEEQVVETLGDMVAALVEAPEPRRRSRS
jgi:AcrR family transcriptional regulator